MILRLIPLSTIVVLSASAVTFGREIANTPAATSRMQLTFTERSPLSSEDAVRELFNDHEPEFPPPGFGGPVRIFKYDLPVESFDVFVPATYRNDVPHGLLVWMGKGTVPDDWLKVLARHKLIYISANQRTNDPIPKGLHLDAVHNMQLRYNIDANRIFASGYSAGANLAIWMIHHYPQVFRGTLCIMGGSGFYDVRTNRDGRYVVMEGWPPCSVAPSWKGELDQIKRQMQIVMIRGERDPIFVPAQFRAQYDALLLDGFQHVNFFVVPRLAHQPPSPAWLQKGLVALDHAKPHKAPTTAPTKDPDPRPAQVAMAGRLLLAAELYFEKPEWKYDARPYVNRILKEYSTTPAAARARDMLHEIDAPRRETMRLAAANRDGVPVTGTLLLSFTVRSPLSADEQDVNARIEPDRHLITTLCSYGPYVLSDEVFRVVVPASYQPNVSHGLFIWMGARKPFPPKWHDVLARHNLIFIRPLSPRSTTSLYQMPLDAVHNLKKLYNVDEQRIYAGGATYGARFSASLVRAYPEVFSADVAVPEGEFNASTVQFFEKLIAGLGHAKPKPSPATAPAISR
jgi:acetyl esterase/lipase